MTDKSLILSAQKLLYNKALSLIQDYISCLRREGWNLNIKERSSSRQVLIEMEDRLMDYYPEFQKMENLLKDGTSDIVSEDFKRLKDYFYSLTTRGVRTFLSDMYPEFKQKVKRKKKRDENIFSLTPSEIIDLADRYGDVRKLPLGYGSRTSKLRHVVVSLRLDGTKYWKLIEKTPPRRGATYSINPAPTLNFVGTPGATTTDGSSTTMTTIG